MYFKKVGKWRNPGIKDNNEVDKCVQKFCSMKILGPERFCQYLLPVQIKQQREAWNIVCAPSGLHF